jgi:CRP-like cAMP-binding protein
MVVIMSAAIAALFEPATTRRLRAGEALFRAGDRVEFVALVQAGRIDLVRHGVDGTRMILQRAGPGVVVAEASVYAASYHCEAIAAGAATVALTPVAAFRSALAAEPRLAEAWGAHLARAVQAARLGAEIRTLRTVAARLDAWLEAGGTMPRRGALQDLAAELGVSREALYRELAQRR